MGFKLPVVSLIIHPSSSTFDSELRSEILIQPPHLGLDNLPCFLQPIPLPEHGGETDGGSEEQGDEDDGETERVDRVVEEELGEWGE